MASTRYSDLLVENREIFIPHLYLPSPQGWPRRNFVKMFDADKTRMIRLPYGEKLWRYVKLFSSNTETLLTDRHNCYINIARQCADARKKVNVKRYTLQQKFSEVSVGLCEAMGFQQPSSKLSTTDGWWAELWWKRETYGLSSLVFHWHNWRQDWNTGLQRGNEKWQSSELIDWITVISTDMSTTNAKLWIHTRLQIK